MVDDEVARVIEPAHGAPRDTRIAFGGLARKPRVLAGGLLAVGAIVAAVAVFEHEATPDRVEADVGRPASHASLSGLQLSSTVTAAVPMPVALPLPGAPVITSRATLAVDLDGDGLPELVTADPRTAQLSVSVARSGPGEPPAFEPAHAVTLALGHPASLLAAGDIDGDGRGDLVVASESAAATELLINVSVSSGAPMFRSGGLLDIDTPPSSLLLVDVSGDGLADLVALQRLDHETDLPMSLAVRVNVSSRRDTEFAPARRFPTGYLANGVAASDFDGDGRTDLAVSNAGSGTVTVLRNSSVLTVNFSVDQTLAARRGVTGVAAGDVDGDGRPDLVVVEPADDRIALFRNRDGRYGDPVEVAATAPGAIALADLRGDDRPELIVAHGGAGGVSMRVDVAPRGSPHARLLPEVPLLAPGAQALIVAADFDGDRRVELALQPVAFAAEAGGGLEATAPLSLFRHPFPRLMASRAVRSRQLAQAIALPTTAAAQDVAADLPRRATQ